MKSNGMKSNGMKSNRRSWSVVVATILVLGICGLKASAQEHGHETAAAQPGHGTVEHGAQQETTARPSLSADATWAGVVVIVILGLFAMAAAVGPIMRSEMVEEAPVSHGHDDPHHAHGHGH